MEEQSSKYTPIPYNPLYIVKDIKCAQMNLQVVPAAQNKRKYAIALYILRPKTYNHFLNVYINRVRRRSRNFQIHSKDNGFYMVNFENQEDYDKVLGSGPYFYNKKLIILKKNGVKE